MDGWVWTSLYDILFTKITISAQTPLHEAANSGNPLMIYFLIVNGVDPLELTNQGHSAPEILRSSRPKVSADESNHVLRGFELSQTILEKAEKGKDLDNKIINIDAIQQSKEIMFNMPGLANALAFYELDDTLEELFYLNENIINETDEHGWVSKMISR